MNISHILWLTVAFLLSTEGSFLAFSTPLWRKIMRQMIAFGDGYLRKLGLTIGGVAVAMAALWHFFPQLGAVWLATALMLLIEGLLIGFSPANWRKYMQEVLEVPDSVLRRVGRAMFTASIVIIVIIFWRT